MTSQTNTPVPAIIYKLVETFEQNLDSYHSSKNETELRREFLDKFFAALGWDVSNEKGYDEAHKEVNHEFSVEVAGQGKKADYAFRAGANKFDFLVEAKKPSVKVESSQDAAFQLRRYGWSAKLPINILTDFEHLAVYDCRAKPNHADPAAVGRIKLIHYQEYVDRWHELIEIFSPEAVRQGSFAQYTAGLKGKKGTADVDDAFLEEIERWRELLARNIALRNKDIDIAALNYTVQMTIDRIVFLRICEEREIEPENQLQAIANKNGVYQELCELFKRADTKYNSGLFHFKNEKGQSSQPDDLTLALEIDDKVLKDIILNLYYPKSPYAFLYIPSDILGQVYERFLGKVIRLTAGHQAKVEEKPEVRKAGGVYYTPTYIVEYIVKNTVGQLVDPLPLGEGRVRGITPKDVAALKIVDPACGSGTFLLGAYQYLLDWHLKWYADPANEPRKWEKNGAITRFLPSPTGTTAGRAGGEGGYRLSTAKKKEILLNNIFGVDIDAQAVEVTKLSLLLKVLENASGQLSLALDRVLPDLGNNIKCGNSLIGFDYFEGRLFPDEEERARVNPFDWQSEFKGVFAKGGFDAVIGNPPYIRIHNLVDYYPGEVRFIQNHYSTAIFGKVDIYVAFVEKGLEILNHTGMVGYILPNKFMQADYGVGLRTLINKKRALTQLVDFGNAQVFENATAYTCLLFLSNSPKAEFEAKFNKSLATQQFLDEVAFEVRKTEDYSSSPWQMASLADSILLNKLESIPVRLSDVIQLAITGVKTGANSIFVFEVIELGKETARLRPEDTAEEVELETKYLVQYLKAESLKRYRVGSGSRVLLYPYQNINGQTRLVPEAQIKENPRTWRYLSKFKRDLEGRQKGKLKGPNWYGLSFSSSLQMFSVPKIITPTLSPQNSFSLDLNGNFFPQGAGGGCGLVPKENISANYLLGLLNSQLLTFYFQRISSPFQGGWFAYEPRYLNRIPIRTIDFTNPAEKAQHDKMVSLVEQMLALHKNLPAAKTPQEKERLKRQIEATDRAIDTLVYALYGLNDDEIRLVEEG